MEFNTAVEKDGKKGWLNIGYWVDIPFDRDGNTVIFRNDVLKISFTGVGIEGSCPAEKDNAGCFFLGDIPEMSSAERNSAELRSEELHLPRLRPAEQVTVNKEFCDCEFSWHFSEGDAHGVSIGKALPAFPSEPKVQYPKQEFTVQNAAAIPCEQVLGTYKVIFDR